MLFFPWLWAVFTVIAAAAQTVRNATQRELTQKLGTVGRDPRAVSVWVAVRTRLSRRRDDRARPRPAAPDPIYWAWVVDGAGMQFAATALMLAAMGERSFVVDDCLHQDRADAGRAVRAHPAGRSGHVADGGRHRYRDGGRGADVGQAGRDVRWPQADPDGVGFGRAVRSFRDWISRRHSQLARSKLRDGGDIHTRGRAHACKQCY